MSKVVSSSTLRNHLADVLKEIAQKKQDYLLVTKKGKLASAIVDIDFFEDLLALASPKYLKSIQEARKDYEEGRVFNHEDVFGEL